MSESFSVGDLVEITEGTADANVRHCIGMEGRIDALDIDRMWSGVRCHGVVTSTGERLNVAEPCLRKRRPPQDWVKLCNLTNLPTRLQMDVNV